MPSFDLTLRDALFFAAGCLVYFFFLEILPRLLDWGYEPEGEPSGLPDDIGDLDQEVLDAFVETKEAKN